MAYSGTVSQTAFDTRRVIEHAARRCKLPAQSLTSEHVDIAKDQLYLLLSELANRGIQLWCIKRTVYPLYNGAGAITTIDGTVDVLNSNLRTIRRVTGTDTTAPGSVTTDFASPATVAIVGVKWGSASAPLALERSADGIAWDTVQTENATAAVGEWTWFDLRSVVASRFFRVRATTGSPTYTKVVLANTPTEIPLYRMSRDDYTNLPNKAFTSNRPLQFWLDRQVRVPVMRLWPVPNAAAEYSQIVVWAQRHIMDAGTLQQEVEVPQRWYEAIVSLLAAKLAAEFIEVDAALVPALDQRAKEALYFAQQEERDNSPINILPNISMYTA